MGPGQEKVEPNRSSTLSAGERKVLRLLAQGHTAKSIAKLTGLTPVAVNERLRHARRKTGVGSSRELARLLQSDETPSQRPNRLRLAVSQAIVPHAAEPWHLPIVGAMIGLFVVVIAASAVFLAQVAPRAQRLDPLYARVLAKRDPAKVVAEMKMRQSPAQALQGEGGQAILRAFYAKVRTEPRDVAWARPAEATLRSVFASVPHVGVKGTEFRVRCAATLCEVAGTIDTSSARTPDAVSRELNRATMPLLNPKALSRATGRADLENAIAVVDSTAETPPRPMFLFYYLRQR